MSEQEFNILFSKNLNYYLKREGKSQLDLAKHLGVSTSAVSAWCRGLKTPRMDKVDAMCEYFGIKRSDLMEDKSSSFGYYSNPETAKLAQEMFEDGDMRSLFHMKRNMEPEKFRAHIEMMQKMYKLEHPEDGDDFGC